MSAGRILGYLDRWSARPGETLACHVSCEDAERYDVALVRIVQGDTHPDAPGYHEEPVAADIGGPFAARFQPIETGSMAVVADNPLFAALASFTVTLAVWPTTPARGAQTLFARRDPASGHGFEFYLDKQGAPTLEIVTPHGTTAVCSDSPLLARHWYRLVASYDSGSGRIGIGQHPKRRYPLTGDTSTRSVDGRAGLVQSTIIADLTMAARNHPQRGQRRHFNGRIDNPTLHAVAFANPLGDMQPDSAATTAPPLAAWDLGIDIPSQRITDTSANHLHGRLLNLPTRGVTGYHWDGSTHAWPHAPAHYTAIHFHDDDLYDAQWHEDFRWRVPDTLASGVYALRLHAHDDEFYLPFCVRAKPDAAHNTILYLMPTASYMAYANNRIGLDVPETELVCGRLIELTEQDLFMQTHPELGLCFYDLHNDGSGVYYSSRLRPVMDMQPKFVAKLGGAGSNVWQFNADSHILGWLEATGAGFDVVTDEDLHHEGVTSIADYRVLVTGTHPEYYSQAMRAALDAFIDGGGRLMYLGGNGFYWRVSFHDSLPGVIECRKSEDGIRAAEPGPGEYYASFTGEYTGLWRRNGLPPNTLAGVGMVAQGFDISSAYRRTDASHDPRVAFIFNGVDGQVIGDFGLSGGAAAGIELDAANVGLGTPPHALVLASSWLHTDVYLMTPEDMLDPAPGMGGTEAEIIRADLVFFETAAGGAVFSVGSIAWGGSMAWNGYDNDVARITGNVLGRFCEARRFAPPMPDRTPPSPGGDQP